MANYSDKYDAVPLSVFEEIEQDILKSTNNEFYDLHQGKTTFPPSANITGWKVGDFDLEIQAHASPPGIKSLRERILNVYNHKHLSDISEQQLLVTCGATQALHSVISCVTDANSEILILSPQWLFTAGVILAAGATPVEVPIFLELDQNANFDFIKAIEEKCNNQTRAIYFNSPNNPTGYSFNKEQLSMLISLAKRKGLWLLADNAYENYDFSDAGFIDCSTLADASDITFSIYSFSKTYSMPGYRIGFVISPKPIANTVRKSGLYTLYSISTASQFGAFKALETDAAELYARHLDVKQARNLLNEELRIPTTKIDGGFYTLLDLSQYSAGSTQDFINRAIQAGVSLAPGIAFGKHCEQYARLCFTAVTLPKLRIAIGILNAIYLDKSSHMLKEDLAACQDAE